MTERHPDDVTAIAQLVEDNVRLSAELHLVTAAYGQAQLRIEYLQRILEDTSSGRNMREFDRLRETALDNAKKGVVA